MRVTPKLRRLIAQRATEDVIREAAQSGGMASLGDDGLQKVKSGVTTAEELLRVITEVTEMRTICPSCSGAVAVDFTACPHCGRRLNPGCGSCGRALQAGWAYCPYCANATTSAEPVKAPVEASKWQARTPLDRERGARELPTGVVTEFKKI
jgi:RNA polymerase subunit RPABC4/transcription elongation factor Spt4